MISLAEAKKLINKFGSPLFVAQHNILLQNVKKYQKHFGHYKGGFNLCYSVKTNPIVSILEIFRKQGVLAEVCSASDILATSKAGYAGRDIIFDGLVKKDSEIQEAIRKNYRIINIESFNEARKIESLAKKYKTTVNVGIRIAFPSSRVGLKSLLGISYDRFGFDLSTNELKQTIDFLSQNKHLKLIGLHCHTGSNQKTAKRYLVGINTLVNLMSTLKNDYGIEISILNLGGGFGIDGVSAYSVQDLIKNMINRTTGSPIEYIPKPINFKLISSKIISHLENSLRRANLKPPVLMLEPGRSLVGNSTDLISSVITTKKTKHRNWIIIDAGTNVMPVLTMYSEFHHVIILGSGGPKIKTSISGPLLYSSDIVVSDRLLPKSKSGDIVIIKDAGAYFSCQANQFLQPRPATVLIQSGHPRLIQRRETVKDLLLREVSDK